MRYPDWEDRLGRLVEARRDMPFAWGKNDCALFAAAAVKAMTGVDFAKAFRGRYRTQRGAAAALRRYGQGTLTRTLNACFGPSVKPAFLQRGDVTMHKGAVGIVMGENAVFVGAEGERDGLVRINRAEWSKGWRIV